MAIRVGRDGDDVDTGENEEEEEEEDEELSTSSESLPSEDVLDAREKFLIFTMGSTTYTPHQIGISTLTDSNFQISTPMKSKRILEANVKSIPSHCDQVVDLVRFSQIRSDHTTAAYRNSA